MSEFVHDPETAASRASVQRRTELMEHARAALSADPTDIGTLVVHRERTPVRDAKGHIMTVIEAEWVESLATHAAHRNALPIALEERANELRVKLANKEVALEKAQATVQAVVADHERMRKHVIESGPRMLHVLPEPAFGESAADYLAALGIAEHDLVDLRTADDPQNASLARIVWVTRA